MVGNIGQDSQGFCLPPTLLPALGTLVSEIRGLMCFFSSGQKQIEINALQMRTIYLHGMPLALCLSLGEERGAKGFGRTSSSA